MIFFVHEKKGGKLIPPFLSGGIRGSGFFRLIRRELMGVFVSDCPVTVKPELDRLAKFRWASFPRLAFSVHPPLAASGLFNDELRAGGTGECFFISHVPTLPYYLLLVKSFRT